MKFKPYAKGLAVAVSLAVMAGCSSSGGTQDGSMNGTGGGTAGGMGAGGQGVSGGQVSGTQMGGGQQQQAGIPDVRTIYFDYDKDTIRPEFESVLNSNAQYLRSHPNANVVLQGHTDERGTREYNLGLGERRAQSVERFLTVQGVSPSQIDVVSYGEERPAVEGHNEQAYAKNRRVILDY
ncbi:MULTISPECIES: peptidoglycan-associated lipoprotein Pal [Modicisalibacter]|uniref:peptidoglycan-associated lipoprotein Pal n=1 Tax=Modicisalibacter TaxID=574347 RepID=UPI00100C0F67|nr:MULTISPECIES: peptidoglycan-associated lipoprotein Pal [Halomonadaceae]MBZ9556838.1 peptidoglycan-associated lipoprotein Pal [Modicisalibacter sp. R2A 31.J]MBZ9574688.1 peptidoglycan-associated lipoprotein Pal [Modicisalibacter sp. MOD 31.J]